MNDWYIGMAWGLLIGLREWHHARKLERRTREEYEAGRRDERLANKYPGNLWGRVE